MDIKQEYLPIIEIDINLFLSFDCDKNEEKIKMLVGKYIIFELKNDDGIITLPGKLLQYTADTLLIRQYDDGLNETKSLWTDYDGADLFKGWEESINIDNILGIEEYKKCNPNFKFKEEYKNCICEITTKDEIKIPVFVHGYDGYELEFDIKYKIDNEIFIGTSQYPLYFVKDIKVLNVLD